MRINPFIYGLVVTAVFFGIIGGFQAAGFWSTSGKVSTDGQAIQPLADDPNSIKGWMTLDQIVTVYEVPLPELLVEFDLPASTDPKTAIKDLESDTFSVEDLRIWLVNRSTGTAVPVDSTPVVVIESEPTIEATPVEAVTVEAAVTPTVHAPAPMSITGKTTYQELLDWGLSRESIEDAIGGPIPDPSVVIKDDVVAKGMEFAAIKTSLQAALDALP